jgi:hypothetical protein
MLAIPLTEAPIVRPLRPYPVLIPEGFTLSEAEARKISRLSRMVSSNPKITANLLVYLLRYLQENPRGLAVAQVPEVLAQFPVKWGYKKKRNDFLKLLIDLEFIYVKINYWAKIRARQYALAQTGRELIERLATFQPLPAESLVYPRPDTAAFI